MGERIFDARCPECSRWVKVTKVWVDFGDCIVRVEGICKRHGPVDVRQFAVWP